MKQKGIILSVMGGAIVVAAAAGFSAKAGSDAVAFKSWPQAKFKGVRMLVAEDSLLKEQGFAGAPSGEFEKTLVFFSDIGPGTVFTNREQGFGPVVRDLRIVFFDAHGKILKADIMRAKTGESVAPPGTAFVIEGLP